jgi:hypothetical protein
MMHNLKTMPAAFYQSESDQPHPGRARAIIKAHPEVRQLMVRNPWTALIALSVVVLQTSLAFCFGKLGFGYWWLSLVIAFRRGGRVSWKNGKSINQIALRYHLLPTRRASQWLARSASCS